MSGIDDGGCRCAKEEVYPLDVLTTKSCTLLLVREKISTDRQTSVTVNRLTHLYVVAGPMTLVQYYDSAFGGGRSGPELDVENLGSRNVSCLWRWDVCLDSPCSLNPVYLSLLSVGELRDPTQTSRLWSVIPTQPMPHPTILTKIRYGSRGATGQRVESRGGKNVPQAHTEGSQAHFGTQ